MLVNHKQKVVKFFIYLLVLGFFTTGFFVSSGFISSFSSPTPAVVYAQSDMFGVDYASGIGLTQEDPRLIVVRILRAALGVLAIVALILIIIAGVIWMTAGGDSNKVEKAQKILLNTVIGLIIILLALAIVQYIFGILNKVAEESVPTNRCTIGSVRNNCWECVDDGMGGSTWRWNSYLPTCGGNPSEPNPEYDFAIRQIETTTAGQDYKTDVYQCSRIQTIFNYRVSQENFDSLTKNDANDQAFKILNSSADIFSGSWQTLNNIIIFKHPDPNSQLFSRDSYQLYNPKELKDVISRNLAVCSDPLGCDLDTDNFFRWDFNVGDERDTQSPQMVSAYPTRSTSPDRNVDRAPVLSVNFSESIDGTTVNSGNVILERLDGQGGSRPLGVDIEDLNFRLTNRGFIFSPVNYLEKFSWYRITVQNVEDLCGNIMDPVLASWEFQTNDQAPGISRFYPPHNATRVCPTTVIAVTFNTSMWDSQVYMLITGNDGTSIDVRMPEPQTMAGPNYTQTPEAGSSDNGHIQIMDTANNREFRTYVYYPQWPLSLNTRYSVSIGTTKQADTQGNMVSGSWDFSTGESDDCVCTPYITTVSPNQGYKGSCITLSGYCFGGMSSSEAAHPTQVLFDGNPGTIGDWDTAYDSYRYSYLTTSVPLTYSEGERANIGIRVDYDNPDYGTGVDSNTVSFYVNSNQVATGPCLWSLRPNHICYNRDIMAKGDRFGNDPGQSQRSTDQNHFDFVSGSLRTPNDNILGWSNQQIGLSLPAGTSDGDASVTALGSQSNSIWFDLTCGEGSPCYPAGPPVCSNGNNICSPGYECKDNGNNECLCLSSQLGRPCDSDSDQPGCQADNGRCGSGYYCADNCRCRPGQGTRNPKIMKVWPECTTACVNAGIGAKFNKKMNPNVFNSNNIKIYICSNTECSLEPLLPELSLDQIIYNDTTNEVSLIQDSNLAVNQSYRVVMRNLVDQDGLSLSNLNFENNKSYSWVFKTKNDPNNCEAAGISVSPVDLVVRRHNVGIKYNGYVYGFPDNCSADGQFLNSWNYNWEWTSSNTSIANLTNNNSNGDNFIDPFQIASVHDQEGETQISTILTPGGHTDATTLTVKLGIPDCTQSGECPGSVWDLDEMICTPVINSFSPASGPIGSCVTIQGCHFGNRQGFGQVDLGDAEVDYPCPGSNHWREHEIIVSIPEGAESNPLTVTNTYGFEVASLNNFNITADCQGSPIPDGGVPCLCRLEPNQGGQDAQVDLFGHNFGGNLAQSEFRNDVSFAHLSGEISGKVVSWENNIIKAIAPEQVESGDVIVYKETCQSNALNFKVILGGVGDSCDSDDNNQVCDASNNMCALGLFCDENRSCTCQLVEGPAVGNSYPSGSGVCRNTAVSVNFNQKVNTTTLNQKTIQLTRPREDGLNCDGNPIIVNQNNDQSLLSKISKFIKKIFYSKVLAQPVVWCPVSGMVQARHITEGNGGCTNPDGCTKVNFYSSQILNPGAQYRILVQGGKQGVRNPRGGYMTTDYTSTFSTGDSICKINDLVVEVFIGDGAPAATRDLVGFVDNIDYFTCAGNDNCLDDASLFYEALPGAIPGNQHVYIVEPIDREGNTLSGSNLDVEWVENDPENIIESISDIDPNFGTQWMKYVTASNNNGEGKVIIRVSDPNPNESINFGSANTAVYITNYLCENPWPSYAEGFPFVDTCQVAYFSTFYCRDAGAEGTQDDLPALNMAKGPCSPNQEVMREHLWVRDDNSDAVGVRIFNNSQHYSPGLWYRDNVPNPGSPAQSLVDGYQAVKDGRTTYVNGANLGGNTLYTNIYLISYNENADLITKNIYDQLLDNWTFNINVNTWTCDDAVTSCYEDSDCSVGVCQSDRGKIRRDLTRIQDVALIGSYLESFNNFCELEPSVACVQNSDCQSGRCIFYPTLSAGTFMSGRSTSKWPSWSATLGNELGKALPEDPINEFYMNQAGSCTSNIDCFGTPAYPQCYKNRCVDTPMNIDPETYWNENEQTFVCPNYSRVYQYESTSFGQQFYIYMNLEYNNHNWHREFPTHFSAIGGECRNYRYSSELFTATPKY